MTLFDYRVPRDRIAVQRQMWATDRHIDEAVHHLYGLTEGEHYDAYHLRNSGLGPRPDHDAASLL